MIDVVSLCSYEDGGMEPQVNAERGTGHKIGHIPAQMVPIAFPETAAYANACDIPMLAKSGQIV